MPAVRSRPLLPGLSPVALALSLGAGLLGVSAGPGLAGFSVRPARADAPPLPTTYRLVPAGEPVPADCDDLDLPSLIGALELELPALESKDGTVLHFGRARQTLAQYARRTLQPLLALGRRGRAALCQGLTRDFELYRPAALKPGGQGHFSAYYHPVVRGSRQRSAAYAVPLYLRPTGADAPLATLTTAEVFAGGLAGRNLELVFLSSLATALLVHVEGSATVQLEGGGEINLTPDGSNGHPYTNVYKLARRDRIVPDDQKAPPGWSRMRAYFEDHPESLRAYWAQNPRFVFFRETPHRGTGKFGPLWNGRSMAVDPRHVPLGAALWLRTELAQPAPAEAAKTAEAAESAKAEPQTSRPGPLTSAESAEKPRTRPGVVHVPIARVALAQDTGAGIVGPGRVDVFCGSGPAAEVAAALTSRPGDLFVLKAREKVREKVRDRPEKKRRHRQH